MKKIGIIGGLGPESTLDYYSGIINPFKAEFMDKGFPEIYIESLNLRTYLKLAENNQWDQMAELLIERIQILKQSGADFGVIASNTPHKVFRKIQGKTTLPLISIVEATCEYAKSKGLTKLCLLGTKFTMSSDYYQEIFTKHGIELVVPGEREQDYIQVKLFSEIEFGIIKEDTRNHLLNIYQNIKDEHGTEGLILGCTELPLIIKPEDIDDIYLDTTAIHIEKIVEYCRS